MKAVVSGVLLLDKPSGISSHSALAQAKRLLMSPCHDSKKAGHTGTLDPMATGLLPICFGEATKFSQFGLEADKGYTATIQLGAQTDTGDKEGQKIAAANVPIFDQIDLDVIAKSLIGEQWQIPPMYSALKKDGKKLYEYARAGINIEREARPIYIDELSLTKLSDSQLGVSVRCSKGTYVRVLGETIAESLGTYGYLISLHRTQTGGFDVNQAITLERLRQLSLEQRLACLLPIDVMMTHLPRLSLELTEVQRVQMGQRLNVKDRVNTVAMPSCDKQLVRLYYQQTFVGLSQVERSGRLQPIRLLNCNDV